MKKEAVGLGRNHYGSEWRPKKSSGINLTAPNRINNQSNKQAADGGNPGAVQSCRIPQSNTSVQIVTGQRRVVASLNTLMLQCMSRAIRHQQETFIGYSDTVEKQQQTQRQLFSLASSAAY